jgi:hypothetical protein
MEDYAAAKAVHVLASLHVGDDPAGAVALARRWFELGWELLGGDLRVAVDGHDPALAAAIAPRGFEVGWLATEELPYAPGQWPVFLDQLQDLPDAIFSASPMVRTMPELDLWSPAAYWASPYYLGMRLDRFEGGVINLKLVSRHELVMADLVAEARMVGFLEAMTAIRMVDYAEVSYGYGGTELTMLELDLGLSPSVTMAAASTVLRGYSWITVVPPGIAAGLGGTSALVGSGVFHRVEQLPHGSVWLQASEHFDDYDDERAAAVFGVLAPYLPPGSGPTAYSRHTDSVRGTGDAG